MTPLEHAESIRFWAMRNWESASGAPAWAAAKALFMRVFISERTRLLAMRRRSFWRFRFAWDLMLGMRFVNFRGWMVGVWLPTSRGKIVTGVNLWGNSSLRSA